MSKINTDKKLTIIFGLTLLMLISFSSFSFGLAESIPVIEIEEIKDTFEPSTYLDNDYYIVNPGEEVPLSTKYMGESSSYFYTQVASNTYGSLSTTINSGDVLDPTSNLMSADTRYYTQPFFEGTIEV